MAEYLIQDTTLDAIADAINAKTGGSSAMTPAQMVTAIGSISGGGGEKTLTKLAEYNVTESVKSISITATEQMKNCDFLFIDVTFTTSATDWIYPAVNAFTSVYWSDKGTSHSHKTVIYLSPSATVNGTAIGRKWAIYGTASSGTGASGASFTSLNSLLFKAYSTSTLITSGKVEVWGYV